jgi:hypothetical protein
MRVRIAAFWRACVPSARMAPLALALVLAATPHGTRAQNLEYPVKAAYLYKFAPFVEWPASAFPTSDSPLTICVFGTDPFGRVLDEAVAGQKVEARSIQVQRITESAQAASCHILYVAGAGAPGSVQIPAPALGAPVLTVTDSATNTNARGVIHFVVETNHVRFDIDDSAAQANGLVLSSKLLRLARKLTPRKTP